MGSEDNLCLFYWDGPGQANGLGVGDDGCPGCASFSMKVRPEHCYLLPGEGGRWAFGHVDKVSSPTSISLHPFEPVGPDQQGAPCTTRRETCDTPPQFDPWSDKKWAENEIALNIKEKAEGKAPSS